MTSSNNPLRGKIDESTKNIWGSLEKLPGQDITKIFGEAKGSAIGDSVWYDVNSFIAVGQINSGDTYEYVYADGKVKAKPARFHRYAGGVKISDETMSDGFDADVINANVSNQAAKEERTLRAKMMRDAIGYAADNPTELYSALHKQAISGSSVTLPADCNDTPGTPAILTANIFSGSQRTAGVLEATIGLAKRAIASKVLDSTTGESILRNDGTDTLTLWVHPNFYSILETNKPLIIASAEEDKRNFIQVLQEDYKCEVVSAMGIDSYDGGDGSAAVGIITANTSENFKFVKIHDFEWKEWKEIETEEKSVWVKKMRAGVGYLAVPYFDATEQPYKSQYNFICTPYDNTA